MQTNNKSTFLNQINEDLQDYKDKYGKLHPNINKPEWAMNFWVLDKIYSEDEETIFSQITDYNDKGIDAWVFHEDTKDLYLIQNKYYNDNTPLSNDYVMNDFLVRAIGSLENGTYKRSSQLQKYFKKYKDDPEFKVNLNLYITNDNVSANIYDNVKEWNGNNANKNYTAHIYNLSDIYEEYYGEMLERKLNLSATIRTVNKGTVLNINNKDYGLNMPIDAQFVMTPVIDIYYMIKEAKEKKYKIFDENIREYLGTTGKVNKKISQTLNDDNDRNNFFFYNNGITITCDDVKLKDVNHKVEIFNPQVVNGCQTVSTIYEVLDSFSENTIKNKFENCYVMAKILKINPTSDSMKVLHKNIVTYNNSQNAISEKSFEADNDVFYRIQKEFDDKGFYLCVKQSDEFKFKQSKSLDQCISDSSNRFARFGIEKPKNLKTNLINLEKFLQVILAFTMDSHNAVQNKSKLLKKDTEQNKKCIEFIKNNAATTNSLLDLYCLYLRVEQDKKKDNLYINPFMFIDTFSYFSCDRHPEKISITLDSNEKVEEVLLIYKSALTGYYQQYKQDYDKEYNDMIKDTIDYKVMQKQIDQANQMAKNFKIFKK